MSVARTIGALLLAALIALATSGTTSDARPGVTVAAEGGLLVQGPESAQAADPDGGATADPLAAGDAAPEAPALTLEPQSGSAVPPSARSADGDGTITVDGVFRSVSDWVRSLDPRTFAYVVLLTVLGFAVRRFLRTELARRFATMLVEDVLTNWRLLLLGVTGILLSLASGYTTWDGMTNFTCPARSAAEGHSCLGPMVLSGLITFGIQGVMLIAAWLIGETFAQGLRSGRSEASTGGVMLVRRIARGVLVVSSLAVLVLLAGLFLSSDAGSLGRGLVAGLDGARPLIWTSALLALGVFVVSFAVSQGEIIGPYIRGLKIVLASLPLWVMFLACMATSVFFSFDSLFSTIFPPEERARAAELRTSNQVSGLVADVGVITLQRQNEAVAQLFASEAWQRYETGVDEVIALARRAPDDIKRMLEERRDAQETARQRLLQRKGSAESQLASIEDQKNQLLARIDVLNGEIPPLEADAKRLTAERMARDREIRAKTAEAESEAGGIGTTGKVGRGPRYKEIKTELDRLLVDRKVNIEAPLAEVQTALKGKLADRANATATLKEIETQVAQLKGTASSADQELELTVAGSKEGDATGTLVFDADQLEKLRAAFRERPEVATFTPIQETCVSYLQLFERVESLRSASQGLDCNPSPIADLTARVFALNEGVASFRRFCGKPDSLPQNGTDAVLEFGERCIQISGLAGDDTAALRDRLSSVALNRDDRAHRFVVTWNAFLDGNRLAYLALAIAIAIDGLVFMSGLFGANAVRSRLSDLPHGHSRSAADLEADVDTALLPDLYANARLVLDAMRPMTPEDGFTATVDLSRLDQGSAETVARVLTRGASLGAVRQEPNAPDRYQVRGELLEYLSTVCKRELNRSGDVRKSADLERAAAEARRLERDAIHHEARLFGEKARALEPLVWASLLPDRYLMASTVQLLAQPIPNNQDKDHAAEINLAQLGPQHQKVRMLVSGVLSAGAALKAVARDAAGSDRYLLKPEFMICLANLRERARQEIEAGKAVPTLGPDDMQELFSLTPGVVHRQPLPERSTWTQIADERSGPAPLAPRKIGDGTHAGAHRTTTHEDAASLDEAKVAYVSEFLQELGISTDEADEFFSKEETYRRALEDQRSLNEQRERIEELSRLVNGTIDEVHGNLAAKSTGDARVVLEQVTREVRRLVPGLVSKLALADSDPAHVGAKN